MSETPRARKSIAATQLSVNVPVRPKLKDLKSRELGSNKSNLNVPEALVKQEKRLSIKYYDTRVFNAFLSRHSAKEEFSQKRNEEYRDSKKRSSLNVRKPESTYGLVSPTGSGRRPSIKRRQSRRGGPIGGSDKIGSGQTSEQRHNESITDSFSRSLNKGQSRQGQKPNKQVKIVEEKDDIKSIQIANLEEDSSREKRSSLLSKNVKESQHTPFYYKLEALNEKIRLFKDVFYYNKRDDKKKEAAERIKERHQKIQKDKVKKQIQEEKMQRQREKEQEEASKTPWLAKHRERSNTKSSKPGLNRIGSRIDESSRKGSENTPMPFGLRLASSSPEVHKDRSAVLIRKSIEMQNQPHNFHLNLSVNVKDKTYTPKSSERRIQFEGILEHRVHSDQDSTSRRSGQRITPKKSQFGVIALPTEGDRPQPPSIGSKRITTKNSHSSHRKHSRLYTSSGADLHNFTSHQHSRRRRDSSGKKLGHYINRTGIHVVIENSHRPQKKDDESKSVSKSPKEPMKYVERKMQYLENLKIQRSASQNKLLKSSSSKQLTREDQEKLMKAGRVSADIGLVPSNSRANKQLLLQLDDKEEGEDPNPYINIPKSKAPWEERKSVDEASKRGPKIQFSSHKTTDAESFQKRRQQAKQKFLPKIKSNIIFKNDLSSQTTSVMGQQPYYPLPQQQQYQTLSHSKTDGAAPTTRKEKMMKKRQNAMLKKYTTIEHASVHPPIQAKVNRMQSLDLQEVQPSQRVSQEGVEMRQPEYHHQHSFSQNALPQQQRLIDGSIPLASSQEYIDGKLKHLKQSTLDTNEGRAGPKISDAMTKSMKISQRKVRGQAASALALAQGDGHANYYLKEAPATVNAQKPNSNFNVVFKKRDKLIKSVYEEPLLEDGDLLNPFLMAQRQSPNKLYPRSPINKRLTEKLASKSKQRFNEVQKSYLQVVNPDGVSGRSARSSKTVSQRSKARPSTHSEDVHKNSGRGQSEYALQYQEIQRDINQIISEVPSPGTAGAAAPRSRVKRPQDRFGSDNQHIPPFGELAQQQEEERRTEEQIRLHDHLVQIASSSQSPEREDQHPQQLQILGLSSRPLLKDEKKSLKNSRHSKNQHSMDLSNAYDHIQVRAMFAPGHKKRMSQGNLPKGPPSLLSKDARRSALGGHQGDGKQFNNQSLYQQIEDTLMKQQVVNESLLEKKINKLNKSVQHVAASKGQMRNLLHFTPAGQNQDKMGTKSTFESAPMQSGLNHERTKDSQSGSSYRFDPNLYIMAKSRQANDPVQVINLPRSLNQGNLLPRPDRRQQQRDRSNKAEEVSVPIVDIPVKIIIQNPELKRLEEEGGGAVQCKVELADPHDEQRLVALGIQTNPQGSRLLGQNTRDSPAYEGGMQSPQFAAHQLPVSLSTSNSARQPSHIETFAGETQEDVIKI